MTNKKDFERQQATRKLASTRHKARHFAMQGLYQNQLNATSASEIEAQFLVDYDMKGADLDYYRELLAGVMREKDQLDAELLPLATERTLEECDPVTLALLRLGTFELKHSIDVPYKVAINESVNLAKKFGPQDAHKFVNAVLDRAALQLRQSEIANDQR